MQKNAKRESKEEDSGTYVILCRYWGFLVQFAFIVVAGNEIKLCFSITTNYIDGINFWIGP